MPNLGEDTLDGPSKKYFSFLLKVHFLWAGELMCCSCISYILYKNYSIIVLPFRQTPIASPQGTLHYQIVRGKMMIPPRLFIIIQPSNVGMGMGRELGLAYAEKTARDWAMPAVCAAEMGRTWWLVYCWGSLHINHLREFYGSLVHRFRQGVLACLPSSIVRVLLLVLFTAHLGH